MCTMGPNSSKRVDAAPANQDYKCQTCETLECDGEKALCDCDCHELLPAKPWIMPMD